MSGYLNWSWGNLYGRGTGSNFWASTHNSYTNSRDLGFGSANVGPKNNVDKSYGFALRRVAQLFAPFLPELSATFLFRLCCRAISTGATAVSGAKVRMAASGHLPPTRMQIRTNCTSSPLASPLRLAPISRSAQPSAASPSRALRSLPLSVMMSGYLYWVSGNLYNRGTAGNFWSSTPYAYINLYYLNFNSTNIYPKNGNNKPYGFSLRRVAF